MPKRHLSATTFSGRCLLAPRILSFATTFNREEATIQGVTVLASRNPIKLMRLVGTRVLKLRFAARANPG
jgi:hypothetical protein